MTVVGVTMMWNEADLAEYTVRHMLDQVDYVIVADNRSTDDTRAILESIGDPRLFVVDEPEFGYCQDRVMNALADSARRGAWRDVDSPVRRRRMVGSVRGHYQGRPGRRGFGWRHGWYLRHRSSAHGRSQ
jgi:hypothetical protein